MGLNLKSIVFAAAVHLVLIVALLSSLNFQKKVKLDFDVNAPQIINAKAFSDAEIQAEISRIEANELKQKKQLADEAQALARKAKLEQAKLDALQKKLAKERKLQKQAKADVAKQREQLKKLKQDASKQQDDLSKLKQQKQELAKAKQETEQELQQLKKSKQEAELQDKISKEQLSFVQDEVKRFAALINHKISENWLKPLGSEDGLSCIIAVKLLTSGEVFESKIIKSSGDHSFDRSTLVAIERSSPFPMPQDKLAQEQFRNFTFTFKPEVA